jgi:hypothetical protein
MVTFFRKGILSSPFHTPLSKNAISCIKIQYTSYHIAHAAKISEDT